MSTHDMNIANQGFPAFRADLNNALAALVSNSSSATEPTTTFAYQFWADTGNDLLKQRNAANDGWVDLLVLSTGAPVNVTNDAITEGNSSVEVVDTGTGHVSIVLDGVEVGQIANASGDLAIGVTDTGLRCSDSADAIYPWNISSNASRDAAINLGGGTVRWKDLYLSGGVYLGGTGSSNYLDDYEEGTWTPTLAVNGFNGNPTPSSTSGTYVKIGNMVYVRAIISFTSSYYTDAYNNITGVPFSASGTSVVSFSGNNVGAGKCTGCGTIAGATAGLYAARATDNTSATDWNFTGIYEIA